MNLLIWVGLFWLALRPSETVPSVTNLPVAIGNPAPNFNLPRLDGRSAFLADYAGDVVVINFWATWCPPCKAEMPGINRFYETHRDAGLTVLAVNSQEGESLVRPFIQTNGFSFPVLLDERGDVTLQFNVRSFPTTLILDRNGVIRHMQTGMISEAELAAIILPLL